MIRTLSLPTFSKAHSVAIPTMQHTLGAVSRFLFPTVQLFIEPVRDKALCDSDLQ